MKKILLTNNYPKEPYSIVENELPEGFCLEILGSNSQEALEAVVGQADYILASGRVKITKNVLDKAVKLKMIQRTGVGVDSLDLEEIRKRGIPLYVNKGINAESVAEHTVLLMLACLRKLPILHRNTANGIWKKQVQGIQTSELSGKSVGLVGMGNIARAVVRLLKGFGVEIFYYDVDRLPVENELELGITYVEFGELVKAVDILSLHCPLTSKTEKLIDKEILSKIKDGTVLINTARGGLVETMDLVRALKTGKLAFAGIDVFEKEPVEMDHPLMRLENVILTPHIGGVTKEAFQRMMREAMQNIKKFDEGKFCEIEHSLYEEKRGIL